MAVAYIGSAHGVGTSASVDTTGATLLVMALVYDGSITVSDSKGNTWTALTERVNSGGTKVRIYYSTGANLTSVGSGHTFTTSLSYGRVIGAAFSGTGAYEAEATASDSGFTVNAVNAGSLTPSENGCLLVAITNFGNTTNTFAIDSGYALPQAQTGVSGISYGGGLGYLIQSTAGAVNPQFTWGGSAVRAEGAHAVFKSSGGGGGSTQPPRSMYLNRLRRAA